MATKKYNPTTPSRRGMTSQDFSSITTKRPLKSLVQIKKGAVARNHQGRITVRHRGGRVKRYLRDVNFNLPQGTKAVVEHIEYDPNRSSRLARIKDQDGKYHYILAAKGMKPGTKITVDEETSITKGNRLLIKNIPTGTSIHAIEMQPGKGAQMVRSAGASARLVAKEDKYAQVKLSSGEIRRFSVKCWASIGTVGNEQHQNIQWGNAGRMRRKGIRPTVRGIAMNAVDHPMGGGDGGAHGLGRNPKSPWGQPTLGYKTRNRKKSNSNIIRSRHQGKRR